MRRLMLVLGAVTAAAQQPIAVGPDNGAGIAPGIAKYFKWYNASPKGCSNGSGFCVGPLPQGDTYYFTAWLPDASQLPVKKGLPVVGTINDYHFGNICGGNVGVVQLDAWSWANPSASHMSLVNCLATYTGAGGPYNSPAGWSGALTSGDKQTNGSWKTRMPFSKGGVLYLPIERQIQTGQGSVHDATMIMSPDGGKHWCNPNTYANHTGGPGCDSSNWDANGDPPHCDSAGSSATACAAPSYTDPAHSSMMWKALGSNTENWNPINYGYQDGTAPPSEINDGCDPATYTCFYMIDASLARVPNDRILDISAWQYYTCPAITESYRCPGTAPASWSSNLNDRAAVMLPGYYLGPWGDTFLSPYSIIYLKEFKSYLMTGDFTKFQGWTTGMKWSATPYGPWTPIYVTKAGESVGTPAVPFFAAAPALGYNVISTNPPHVQMTITSNDYQGGEGSPQFSLWDLVLGQSYNGEAFQAQNLGAYVSGAGYQFSAGNVAGTFPRNGLAWAFDFQDHVGYPGATNWPYWADRALNLPPASSPTIKGCGGSYTAPSLCGGLIPGHGYTLNPYGIKVIASEYGGHFRTYTFEVSGTLQNAPPSMVGNGSYSVVMVMRYEGGAGGIWSTGVASAADNTMVELNYGGGALTLDWNATNKPRYRYVSNFGFPNTSNWYFIVATVAGQTGCGSNCTPAASLWVGGAASAGVLGDTLAGAAYAAVSGAASKTPNVSAGPLVIGLNGANTTSSMTVATTMIYNRALTQFEVELMYQTMKTKMAARGVTLQ